MQRLITTLNEIDDIEHQLSQLSPEDVGGEDWERLTNELRAANRIRKQLEK